MNSSHDSLPSDQPFLVALNCLRSDDYAEAILAFFEGQTKPLAEVRAEMDKREKKINVWLEEVKSAGKESGKK